MEDKKKMWLVEKLGPGLGAAIVYAMVFMVGKEFVVDVAGLFLVAGIAGFIAAGWFYEECRKNK